MGEHIQRQQNKEKYLTVGRFRKLGKGYDRCCGSTAITNLIMTLQDEAHEESPDEVFLSVAKAGIRRGIYVNMDLFKRFGGTSNLLSEPYIKLCLKKNGIDAELQYLGRLTEERLERAVRRGSYLYLELLFHPKYGNHHILCYGAEKQDKGWVLRIADGWSGRPVFMTVDELKRTYAIEVLHAASDSNGMDKEREDAKMHNIQWTRFPDTKNGDDGLYRRYSYDETEDVRAFHKTLDAYQQTPLVPLSGLAAAGGIKAAFIKDESHRFGLKAFKGLGGVYAMFRMICQQLGLDHKTTDFAMLQQPTYQEKIRELVFVTTTDGNHGKGVSWAAGLFGCKAYVFMPRGTVEVRAQAIRDAGSAEVSITDMTYDRCVAYTADLAEKNGWLLIQDTSWDGYEDVPQWIMLGYTTMLYEALAQMKEAGCEQPTHVFLQAGVGAMAGAAAAAVMTAFPDTPPVITIVEPTEVACIYESARQADGKPHMATGNCTTIMAGLNCEMPCTLAWDIIKNCASYAFACSDSVTEHGMQLLADPETGETPVTAGESGAVTTGLADLLLRDPQYQALRDEMGLNEDAVVLLINTEGDTDPDDYRRVMDMARRNSK